VRRLVLDYYVVLRFVQKDKPEVRRLFKRCRHCRICFITAPCNAEREELGCPFGCADLHRRRRSNERSVAYNRSAVGKLKRQRREEARKLAAERKAAADASQATEVHAAMTVEAEHGAVSGGVEPIRRDRRVDLLPPEIPLSTDQAAKRAESGSCGPASCSAEDPREPGPGVGANAVPAGPERAEFDPGIVSYIRVVISLLEGRQVHREEIRQMLTRTIGQRSFAREKRVDYVLRTVREEPEKPP
jgi:hypothetical protein